MSTSERPPLEGCLDTFVKRAGPWLGAALAVCAIGEIAEYKMNHPDTSGAAPTPTPDRLGPQPPSRFPTLKEVGLPQAYSWADVFTVDEKVIFTEQVQEGAGPITNDVALILGQGENAQVFTKAAIGTALGTRSGVRLPAVINTLDNEMNGHMPEIERTRRWIVPANGGWFQGALVKEYDETKRGRLSHVKVSASDRATAKSACYLAIGASREQADVQQMLAGADRLAIVAGVVERNAQLSRRALFFLGGAASGPALNRVEAAADALAALGRLPEPTQDASVAISATMVTNE